MNTQQFFQKLWDDYTSSTPQAEQILTMLQNRGETVINDHIAFRTINLNPIKLESLEQPLLQLGYSRASHYRFEEKHLDAWSYLHTDPTQPKIFLSAFDSECISQASQVIIDRIIDEAKKSIYEYSNNGVYDWSILISGTVLWSPLTIAEYQTLAAESEYLAWVAALGLRPNHFTVSLNHLKTIDSIEQISSLVEAEGLKINSSGGRVKGTPEQLLEQSSTMASRMKVNFADGSLEIPTCYYEFAKRYPDANGNLFQGFVTTSADKIFESTNKENDNA